MTLLSIWLSCASSPTAPPPAQETNTLAPPHLQAPQVTSTNLLAEAPELVFWEVAWNTSSDRGVAWVIELPRAVSLDLAHSAGVAHLEDALDLTSTRAAINGGFYQDNAAMGLVRREGKTFTPLSPRGGSGVLFQGPTPALITHRDAWSGHGRVALQSIDRLVDGHSNLVTGRPGAPRAARSAVAVHQDSVRFVLVASESSIQQREDGVQLHQTGGFGMTLWEFGEFLAAQGATQALNLDGGISSGLWVQTGADDGFLVRSQSGSINALTTRSRASPQP